MGVSIRGHQGSFKLFQDGAISNVIDITKVSIQQEASFSRTYYVGRPVGESDVAVQGWSGSIDLEVKDASVDDLIDALVANNLAGIGVSAYTFVSTENYSDGTTRSYVYTGCVWKMSKEQGGLNDKITKKLDFQCDLRIKL